MAADPRGADFLAFRDARGHDVHDAATYAAPAADLRAAVSGEVLFDEYSQVLYATDGSIYQARPAGVVISRDVVTAPGASCRTQLADDGEHPPHPVEPLADALH